MIYVTPQSFCKTALVKDQIFALYRKSTTEWGMCNGGFVLMRSPIVKRSVIIGGHKTSVSLEDEFWSGLKEIARAQGASMAQILTEIDTTRQQKNLSSAIRLFVLGHVRDHKRGRHLRRALSTE